eukprot:Skav225710  [mRNA]  locus=scaffold1787:103881:108324:+ [translate_table: standard]
MFSIGSQKSCGRRGAGSAAAWFWYSGSPWLVPVTVGEARSWENYGNLMVQHGVGVRMGVLGSSPSIMELIADGSGAANGSSVMPLLLCTFMIVSMQLGFAMLEVGCVRQEHRMTVLAKNLLDTMVSSLSFSLGCEIFQCFG